MTQYRKLTNRAAPTIDRNQRIQLHFLLWID